MQIHLIERWAHAVIAKINSNQPIEDSLVELKSTWIEPERAAVRIAAHANAAYGAEILWVIGVDEKKGVIGVESHELLNWYSKVQSYFDDNVCPNVTDLNLTVDEKTLVALVFETNRSPYVIKNPDAIINRIVPWRSATSLRTASRSELVSLLSKTVIRPSCKTLLCRIVTNQILEVPLHSASLPHTASTFFQEPNSAKARIESSKELMWSIEWHVYFTHYNNTSISLPYHRLSASLRVQFNDLNIPLFGLSKHPIFHTNGQQTQSVKVESDSPNIIVNEHDININDSGAVTIHWRQLVPNFITTNANYDPVMFHCESFVAGSETPIVVSHTLQYSPFVNKVIPSTNDPNEPNEPFYQVIPSWSLS